MIELFVNNLLSPPVLFFFVGALAVIVNSDLGIPDQISKFLSLYLLFAIGFKGGVALSQSALDSQLLIIMSSAILLSATIPFIVFFIMKRFMTTINAAAVAATYGSISAVTFIATTNYLDRLSISWDGYMVAAMASMEAPAIVSGIALYAVSQTNKSFSWRKIFHESFLNGSVFLIVCSMAVGYITGEEGMNSVHFFVKDIFVGILCLFLLDMGIVAFSKLKELTRSDVLYMSTASIGFPLFSAAIAIAISATFSIDIGNAILLTVLAASASYIAVPAALRLALPNANSSIYLPMSLAITFPFNLLFGIPLYHEVIGLIYE